MSVIPDLNARFDDIAHVLSVIREMERSQKSRRKAFYEKARMISASKASIYIMVYNAIEAAMRHLLQSIRIKIQEEGVTFSDAEEYWRLDAIQARFLHKMASGTNHGMLLAEIVPMTNATLSWNEDDLDRLPFSGNFGQGAAIRFTEQLGLSWRPPHDALGGVDLENIRERRNALAHGLETFHEAGSQVTAQGLIEVLTRIRNFMTSYIAAIESYGEERRYLRLARA